MRKKITFLFLAIGLFSCKNSDKNEKEKIKAVHWLLGKWENKTNDGTLSEIWEKVNDSTFKGQSYFIKDKDTLHFETILLQQNGENLTYKTIIKGQNNDEAVSFLLNTEIENQWFFENPKHDYPQKISYTPTNKNSMVAKISGIQQGKPSSEQYTMTKIE